MITRAQVDELEVLIGRFNGIHSEMGILAKKSPNDGVNAFKLRMINAVIEDANNLLGEAYKAIDGFNRFDADDLPSNSDVTFVVAQYLEAIEKFRSDNVVMKAGIWVYSMSGDEPKVRTFIPAKLKR